jgi:hypothetical protein
VKVVRGWDGASDGEFGKAPRANRHHAVNFLQDPFREQDARAAQQQAMLLKKLRRHDQVEHAGFVFERDEEKSLGGGGALADDYVDDSAAPWATDEKYPLSPAPMSTVQISSP